MRPIGLEGVMGVHRSGEVWYLRLPCCFLTVWRWTVKITNVDSQWRKCNLIAFSFTENNHWNMKNTTCNLSCICSFYNVIILAPIATIFVRVIDSSVRNLMVLKGQTPNNVAFLVLPWQSSAVLSHSTIDLKHLCEVGLIKVASNYILL